MTARVWSWVSEKGGVGKTTNVTNVGCQLVRNGFSVLLVDADPHKSLASWAAVGGDEGREEYPAVVEMKKSLKNDIPKLKRMFDYILIDCEGTLNQTSIDALMVSDMVVVPYSPSPLDVWGNHSLIEIIQDRKSAMNLKVKAVTVLNMIDKRTRLFREIQETLTEYTLPVAQASTSRLTAYIETFLEGRSVTDLNEDNTAAFEVRRLTKELMGFDNEK